MHPMTAELARSVWCYDPQTGVLTWKIDRLPAVLAGDVAGTLKKGRRPHREVHFDGKIYIAARLAWLMMTGKWPNPEVDHVNVDATDDRWLNLREANRSQQMGNTRLRKDNALGVRGVYRSKFAFIAHIGKNYLGSFRTLEDAKAAYDAAASRRFGNFRRDCVQIQKRSEAYGTPKP